MADTKNSILAENLFFLTGALYRKLSTEADETFASVGLSSSHALLLLLIKENPGIQPSSLAGKIHLQPSTITRLVQKLERRNLVERKSEGRTTSIVCTDEGESLTEEVQERWQALMEQKREVLGERYVEVLSEMISNALDTIDRDD